MFLMLQSNLFLLLNHLKFYYFLFTMLFCFISFCKFVVVFFLVMFLISTNIARAMVVKLLCFEFKLCYVSIIVFLIIMFWCLD